MTLLFIVSADMSISGTWLGVATSSSGQYAYAGDLGGLVYVSSNYGNKWTATSSYAGQWQDIATSSTGQYVYASDYANKYIYMSSNYDGKWNLTNAPVGELLSIATSSYGKYVYADEDIPGGNIYASTDYGNSWIATRFLVVIGTA